MLFGKSSLIGLAIAGSANAIKLLVASYGLAGTDGVIQTLDNTRVPASLDVIHTNKDCGAMPSWLDKSSSNNMIMCVDEGSTGGLTMLSTNPDGSLEKLFSTTTLGGPVSSMFFSNESAVALAHYGPPAVSTFRVDGNFLSLQNFTFNNPPGPVPERQDNSHIHQALLDPTGQYMLFADLGADLVHVYCIDPGTSLLVEHAPLRSKPGYGPRHATFWTPQDANTIFLFVIHELSNRITSYEVMYLETGGLSFAEVDDVSTYGPHSIPATAAAAEIVTMKDFVIASNRLGAIFDIPNPDRSNITNITSDSIVTFKPTRDGKLDFVELVPSGGLNPRHFSLNKDGCKIAVANQVTRNVVVYSRDSKSGKIGKQMASASNLGPGELTNVQWLADEVRP